MPSSVEAISWDFTFGFADGWIGKKIIEIVTPTGQNVPPGVYHVALLVFDQVYEHGISGIHISEPEGSNDPGSAYRVDEMKRRDLLGQTKVTKEDFDKWVEGTRAEFNEESYDIATKNCITWATAACEFLGVKPPPEWEDVNGLAGSHPQTVRTLHSTMEKIVGLFN